LRRHTRQVKSSDIDEVIPQHTRLIGREQTVKEQKMFDRLAPCFYWIWGIIQLAFSWLFLRSFGLTLVKNKLLSPHNGALLPGHQPPLAPFWRGIGLFTMVRREKMRPKTASLGLVELSTISRRSTGACSHQIAIRQTAPQLSGPLLFL
jgi:hypothetical protein